MVGIAVPEVDKHLFIILRENRKTGSPFFILPDSNRIFMNLHIHLWRIFFALVSCALLITACGRAEHQMDSTLKTEPAGNSSSGGEGTQAGNGLQFAAVGSGNTSSAQPEQVKVEQPRMMVYTADIRLRVRNVDSSHNRIMALLPGYGAYMSTDYRTTNGGQIENSITIRVTQEKFAPLLDRLVKEAVYIDKKNISSSDVTQEYVDVAARLKSRQLAEEQYREILKRATKISEILEVQQYLNTIREEIESAQGRMRYLQSQASYSTITIALYEMETTVIVPPEDTFTGRLGDALANGWNGLQTLIIGLLAIWPFWILGALFVYGAVRFRRYSRARQVQPTQTVGQMGKSTEEK